MGELHLTLPGLRLHSEANARGRWFAGAERAAEQRALVATMLRTKRPPPLDDGTVAEVIVVRVAPLPLDDDNLARSCKAVRDEVACWLCPTRDRQGRRSGNDRDPRVTWRVAQRRGRAREYGVEVRVRWWAPGERGARVVRLGETVAVALTLTRDERRAFAQRLAVANTPLRFELDGIHLTIATAEGR